MDDLQRSASSWSELRHPCRLLLPYLNSGGQHIVPGGSNYGACDPWPPHCIDWLTRFCTRGFFNISTEVLLTISESRPDHDLLAKLRLGRRSNSWFVGVCISTRSWTDSRNACLSVA